MKKLYLILITGLLISCGGGNGGSTEPVPVGTEGVDYIVSGQSNTLVCDWGYFTELTGYTTYNIARGGRNINYLIENYPHLAENKQIKGIIFVHGESDAIELTPAYTYAARVEAYRNIISADIGHNLPMYVSTVGYYKLRPDDHFDIIRQSVHDYANSNWVIAYDDAQYFRDWGFLRDDGIHFNQYGCEAMMDALAASISG